MARNIIVCCDGTGNEFDERRSNVIKLYKTLICDDNQIAYYHPGVGTMGARNALSRIGKWWTKLLGLAFGYGISDNVADAYQFLMRNYEPEDPIYVFGFSRGAYTARALCGMLHAVGLLSAGNEALIPYAIRMIKQRHIDFGILADFKKTFSRHCKVHFVGRLGHREFRWVDLRRGRVSLYREKSRYRYRQACRVHRRAPGFFPPEPV